jgi:TetR/AcrR family transcriptional regulator, repressor for uid operon
MFGGPTLALNRTSGRGDPSAERTPVTGVTAPVPAVGGPDGRRDRREDLLVAAARRFVAVGIRKTTMEDIAREARAGKATLYRHFANKDAVIDALLEREAERFARRMERAAAEQTDAAARIEAAFLAGVRFFVEHPVMTKGRDEEPGILLPRIIANGGPLVVRGLELFGELIAEGVEAGELRRVDPQAAAEVVVRLILSYFSFPPMVVRVDDPDEASAFAHALVAGGLRASR